MFILLKMSFSDIAGFDLEELPTIDMFTIQAPNNYICSTIFCFRYEEETRVKIQQHFQKLANTCMKEMGTKDLQIDRYRNCAVISIGCGGIYKLILLHGATTNTIEMQVQSQSMQYFDNNLCKKAQTVVVGYLEKHLENITPFKQMKRCQHSSFGDGEGLMDINALGNIEPKNESGDHSTRGSAHQVSTRELVFYYFGQTQK